MVVINKVYDVLGYTTPLSSFTFQSSATSFSLPNGASILIITLLNDGSYEIRVEHNLVPENPSTQFIYIPANSYYLRSDSSSEGSNEYQFRDSQNNYIFSVQDLSANQAGDEFLLKIYPSSRITFDFNLI